MRQDAVVSGSVSIQIEGVRDNQPVAAGACARRAAKTRADGQVPFQFRYFQNLEQDVVLPEGFEPRPSTSKCARRASRLCENRFRGRFRPKA